LTPLLCVMPSSQCGPSVQGWMRGVGLSVKGLAVVEGTGMLCCGHSSGKVRSRGLHCLVLHWFELL
jgi:hypothetical protein